MTVKWPQVELGRLADFRNGLNYTQAARRGGGLPIIGVKDFQTRSFVNFKDLEELDPAEVDPSETLVQQNDILFVRSNGNRDLIGRSLLVAEPPPRPTVHSGFTIRLRFKDERADPRFFAYLLRGPLVRRTLSSQGGGTNINNLNQGILASLVVPLPPQSTQHRIASILGAYDGLIEINERRISLLEEMARQLYEEWFVSLRFPGHEAHSMTETAEGPVPEGWNLERVGTLVQEIRDAVHPSEVKGTTPYVGLEHIPRRSVTLNAWGYASEVTSTKLRFQYGDVLFGKIRPYFHKVIWAPIDGVASSDAIVIRTKRPELAGLVLATVSSDRFVAHSVQTSNGTKMPRANWGVLANYPVLVPADALSRRFNDTVMDWVKLAATFQCANSRLAASRDLLLPRLISGQLSVAAAERELEVAA